MQPPFGASLVAFVIIYFALFGAGTFFILRLLNHAPQPAEAGMPPRVTVHAGVILPGPVMTAKQALPAGE